MVVLSTSFRDSHKQLAYALGAKHYISKHRSLEQLIPDVTEVYRQLTSVAAHRTAQAVTNDATSPRQFGRSPARKNTGGSVESIAVLVVLGHAAHSRSRFNDG